MSAKISFVLSFLFLAAFSLSSFASTPDTSNYFDKEKIYTSELYVLKDYVEFRVFDMSKMQVVNDNKPGQEIVIQENSKKNAPQKKSVSGAEKEVRDLFSQIPTYFYSALERRILSEKVPVTLIANEGPAFSNPIKLYIKVKKIHLLPQETKKNSRVQPIQVLIYGQIKDKKSGKILLRYYDLEESEFALGKKQASTAFQNLSDEMMKNLTRFLKTRY